MIGRYLLNNKASARDKSPLQLIEIMTASS